MVSPADKTLTCDDGRVIHVPSSFICPVSQTAMVHPLMNRDGLNFERQSIVQWLRTHGTCPVTGKPMRPGDLVPNRSLEAKIQFWRYSNGIVQRPFQDEEDEDDEPLESRMVAFISVEETKKTQILKRPVLSRINLFRRDAQDDVSQTSAETADSHISNTSDHSTDSVKRRQRRVLSRVLSSALHED